MATSSIFSSIHIKDEASCRSLLDAMEAAEKAAENRVHRPINIKELKSKEEVKAFFKNK
jgi:hypothetical protein